MPSRVSIRAEPLASRLCGPARREQSSAGGTKLNRKALTGLPVACLWRAKSSTLLGRFLTGSFWVLAGAVGARVLNLITFVVLARTLGSTSLGQFTLAQSTITLLVPLSTVAVSSAVAKYVAQYRQQAPGEAITFLTAGLSVSLLGAVLLASVGLAAADRVSLVLFQSEQMAQQVRLASLVLVGSSVNAVLESGLNGYERFAAGAAVKGVRGVSAVLVVAGASRLYGLSGALAGLAATELATAVAYGVALRGCRRPSHGPARCCMPMRAVVRHASELLRFSGPLLLGWLAVSPSLWLSKRLLAGQPGGYAALGVFGAAEKWYQLALFVSSAVSLFALPTLSNVFAERGTVAHRRLFLLASGLSIAIAGAVALVVSALSGSIVSALGQGFAGARSTLGLLLLASLGAAANTSFGHYFVSRGQVSVRMACDVLLGLVVLACSLLLVPSGRENGVAVTYLVSYTLVAGVLALLIGVEVARGWRACASRPSPAPVGAAANGGDGA